MIQKIPLGSTSIAEAGVPFLYINGEDDETYIGDVNGSILVHFGKLSAAGTSLLISLLATGHIREERLCMAAVIGMGGDKDEATRYASRPATVTPMDSIATDEGSLALLAIVADVRRYRHVGKRPSCGPPRQGIHLRQREMHGRRARHDEGDVYVSGGRRMRVAVIGSRGLTVDDLGLYLPDETTEIISRRNNPKTGRKKEKII